MNYNIRYTLVELEANKKILDDQKSKSNNIELKVDAEFKRIDDKSFSGTLTYIVHPEKEEFSILFKYKMEITSENNINEDELEREKFISIVSNDATLLIGNITKELLGAPLIVQFLDMFDKTNKKSDDE